MAKYDRRLLVPYLLDVYSVELQRAKIYSEYSRLKGNNAVYEYRIESYVPPKPVEDGSIVPTLIAGAVGVVFTIWGYATNGFWALLIWLLAGISFFLAYCFYTSYQTDKGLYKDYLQKRREYNNQWCQYNEAKKSKAVIDQKLQTLSLQKNQIDSIRTQVYSANVIPEPYRNLYAAHFLYSYFSTCEANDIDMIIQTFVLEEIKAKLDKIISQQMEMIINQRIMMANQEKQSEMIAQNHERQMRQLCELNENADKRNQYLSMINANLCVSNYFAYKESLRH